jgi:hypothetical protein
MGGAAVAVSDDGSALWTNPAGFARDPRLDAEILAGGVATNRNEFTAIVDRLSAIDLARLRAGMDLDQIPGAVADLKLLARPGTGVVASGVAGAVFGKSGWAIGIGTVAFAGVYPSVDLVHVLPGNDPATGFANNTSAVSSVGLEAREARLSYAMSFFEKALLVGATARYIQGRTYYVRESAFDVSGSDPAGLARDAFDENRTDTARVAFDAGAMFTPRGEPFASAWPRRPSTSRNSTWRTTPEPEPRRRAGDAAPSSNAARRRGGGADRPADGSADYDLVATDTLVPGEEPPVLLWREWKLPSSLSRGHVSRQRGPRPALGLLDGIRARLEDALGQCRVVYSSRAGCRCLRRIGVMWAPLSMRGSGSDREVIKV